eukprot:3500379-Rhodomonas_salina.1
MHRDSVPRSFAVLIQTHMSNSATPLSSQASPPLITNFALSRRIKMHRCRALSRDRATLPAPSSC